MKAGVIAVAAAMAAGVSAAGHAGRRHAHQEFHLARGLVTGTGSSDPQATCGCTTIYTTITGEGSLVFPPAPSTTSKSIYVPTSSPAPVVPTPLATTCPTPGIYTIPATTITLKDTTTVCAAASTQVPSGTHTYGGVTTVVETATTVVCPYATVSTSEGVVTSVIKTTTYVCPSAGTYTIAPETTTVSVSTVLVYPTPATYAPGTYTQPEVVTTITETNYVVFCPYTSPAPVPTSTYVAPAPAATSEAPKPKEEAPKPKEEAPKPKEEAPKKTSTPAGQLGSDDSHWAITYTPFTDDIHGNCKDADTVAADIAKIASKGFKAVRVYSVDCSALENIAPACQAHGLKMILGIFIDDRGLDWADKQVDIIAKWAQWDLVDLIVYSNEALHSEPPRCSASKLAEKITEAKAIFKAAKYPGLITTAEPLNIWQENAGDLCGAVDIVGVNIHAFFNQDVAPDKAGDFVKGQLDIADGLCPGKESYNLETGWPSHANQPCFGLACADSDSQKTALHSILDVIGSKSVMFSYGNDGWKLPGALGCEQYWGAIDVL